MLRWMLPTLLVCALTPSCAWLDEELMLDDEAYAATFGEEGANGPQIINLDSMHIGGLGLYGCGYSYSGFSIGGIGGIGGIRQGYGPPRITIRPGAAAGGDLPVGAGLHTQTDEEEAEETEPSQDALTLAATRGARHMIERDQERHRALAAWVMENVEAP